MPDLLRWDDGKLGLDPMNRDIFSSFLHSPSQRWFSIRSGSIYILLITGETGICQWVRECEKKRGTIDVPLV
jgi:hypothetical protein